MNYQLVVVYRFFFGTSFPDFVTFQPSSARMLRAYIISKWGEEREEDDDFEAVKHLVLDFCIGLNSLKLPCLIQPHSTPSAVGFQKWAV